MAAGKVDQPHLSRESVISSDFVLGRRARPSQNTPMRFEKVSGLTNLPKLGTAWDGLDPRSKGRTPIAEPGRRPVTHASRKAIRVCCAEVRVLLSIEPSRRGDGACREDEHGILSLAKAELAYAASCFVPSDVYGCYDGCCAYRCPRKRLVS